MKILMGNKNVNINKVEFENILKGYKSVIIDLGTGSGQFVYKKAKNDPDNFYIGIDPCADSMMEYSVKSNKKACRGGIQNILFVIDSVENLPKELESAADKIYINLPWGTLRDGIIKGQEDILNNIRMISKDRGSLEVCVTYSNLYEEKVIDIRNLPELSTNYIKNELKHRYRLSSIDITEIALWNNEDLKKVDSKWAKKLAFGRCREIYYFKSCIAK
jgi:16S rRNA (adenine(1408)-N(1))-methyltransferase